MSSQAYRPGEPVAMRSGSLGDSLAPASGQTFALLPPDNATGNFTKVVQRIPVKIVLDSGSADSPPNCQCETILSERNFALLDKGQDGLGQKV